MTEFKYRFDDGAAYEQMMGIWSGLAGKHFLDWLNPQPNARWIDVGCGNGAFTELLLKACAPVEVQGIDPSEAQIIYARERCSAATFQRGDAMALPFNENHFDAAVMALVIFFVPEPAKSVAEMARVVKPGGTVSAYAWDVPGGGLPAAPFHPELRAMGLKVVYPPQHEASSTEALSALWNGAGLRSIETTSFDVIRSYKDFEEYWTTTVLGPSLAPTIAAMSVDDAEELKRKIRTRLSAPISGPFSYTARANAVKGFAPD
jgi:ubiquinone/menaquinone biosynthesis C-methylase UbiE